MNRTNNLLMISDFFIGTGFGLINPILSIFIKDNLIGGTIFSAGLASALFLLSKCAIQLPFSKYVDRHDDKIKWLIIGTFLISVVPFIYIFSDSILPIYIAQVIHGVGSGLAYPTWLGLWTTNLDKKHRSYDWSIYSTITSIGVAITALVGAAIAEYIGFVYTFIMVWVLSLVGCFILFNLEKDKEKIEKINAYYHHTKRKLSSRNHEH